MVRLTLVSLGNKVKFVDVINLNGTEISRSNHLICIVFILEANKALASRDTRLGLINHSELRAILDHLVLEDWYERNLSRFDGPDRRKHLIKCL